MIDKLKQSTKTKFVHQDSLIVKFLKSKGSLYLLVVSGVLLYAPFAHVCYLHTETKGIFGFRLMVSFLFALALPLVLITSGLVIRFIGSYTPNHVKQFANLLSTLVTISGMFFLLWTFSEIKDFTPFTYYSIILLLSCAFTFLSIRIQKYVQRQDEVLKRALKLLNGLLGIFMKNKTDNDFKDKVYDEFKNNDLC